MSGETNDTLDRLFAHPQRTTRGMMEKSTVYPASHCIYLKREDGKFERLCTKNFAGNYAPEVRDELPFPSLAEGWDNLELLGDGYSCSECAQAAWELIEE